MKDRLLLMMTIVLLAAAIRFCMPETAKELKYELTRLFDPEGFIQTMGHEVSERSLTEVFFSDNDGETQG